MPFHLPSLNRRRFLASGVVLVMLHPFSARAAASQAHLRLMETTDLLVNVFPYDSYSDNPVDTVGRARTATIVCEIRTEATNSVPLDNGDFLQGNPMCDCIAYDRRMTQGDMHAVIAAMNAVGIEASTLGNHEFNYGLDFLNHALAGATCPVVCANIVLLAGASLQEDRMLLPPCVILDRTLTDGDGAQHPIRIGVIGAVRPQV